MSNRTYTIVLSIATTALIAALVASYLLHRLTLSPVAIYLLMFLIGVPAASTLRFLPGYLLARSMPAELRERIRENRGPSPVPAYAVWTCIASFAASFALMIVGALLKPSSSPSTTTEICVMLWFVLFFYGWLGLIFTSPWVQTHGLAIAFAAIPTVGLSAALLFGLAAYSLPFSLTIIVPVGLGLYGMAMVSTPIFVSFYRAFGLID
jgi:hypothetical protein